MNKINTAKIFTNISLIILVIFLAGFIKASASDVAAEYTQSYQTDKLIPFGALVSLANGSEQKIELSTKANARNFLGVNISDSGATLAVNRQERDTQIAVSGKTVALVSDIAGSINNGDLLAVSAIDGVASKANSDDNIIGAATTDFDVNNPKNTHQNITFANGQNQNVNIGSIEMELFRVQKNAVGKPGFIGWIENVSGKPITPFKMASVSIIALAVIVSITAMSYSAIKNTITQSSRNPLARPVIMQALTRIFVSIIIIALFGCILIYLILRL